MRCNPYFRNTAGDLLKLEPQNASDRQQLIEKFKIIDAHNPFAGFALRWLFRPKFVNFHFPRQPHDFLKDWTLEDWKESGFPWIWEDELYELEELLAEENAGE